MSRSLLLTIIMIMTAVVCRMNGDMSLTFALREAELSMELRDAIEGDRQYPNHEVMRTVLPTSASDVID